MIENGGVFELRNENDFKEILERLMGNTQLREKSGKLNSSLIEKNKGAVNQIVSFLRK